MSAVIPDSYKHYLTDPLCVTLTTLMPDGQPQSSVVWCDYDGEHILVNTARDRQKETNMRDRPQVTVLAFRTDDPYKYLEVRGEVTEITEAGAFDHISHLAKIYVGVDSYYGNIASTEQADKETRVICKIKPTHVVTH